MYWDDQQTWEPKILWNCTYILCNLYTVKTYGEMVVIAEAYAAVADLDGCLGF